MKTKPSRLTRLAPSPCSHSICRATAFLFWTAFALASTASCLRAQVSAHSYDRPFDRKNSPWNVPVGSGAVLAPAGLGTLGATSIDVEYLSRSSVLNPEVSIYNPGATSQSYFKLRLPPGFSTLTPGSGFTPNNGTNFLATDGKQLISTNYLHYRNDLAKWLGWYAAPNSGSSIFGTGISGFASAHSGAALPVIGGSIRPGELTANPTQVDTIRHALNLELDWAVMWNAQTYSDAYRWPASAADSGWSGYSGTNSQLKMGALLVIDKNATAESLGIVSAPGKKMLWTLQNYGGYLVDTSGAGYYTNGGYTLNIGAESSVPAAFQATYGYNIENWGRTTDWGRDMDKLYRALKVVTNNSATSIGGGGTRPNGIQPKPLNLVINPDFDQDQAITEGISGWTSLNNTAADRTSTYNTAHSGEYYLVHTGTTAYDVISLQNFTGLPSGTYRASVWVQSSGGHNTARLYVAVKKADGTFDYNTGVDVPAGIIGTWTKITTPAFTIAHGEGGIRLKTVTGANNYVRWDDAEFYRE